MFAILGHNATFEQIFILVEAQWTDERNRFVEETIKYITMVMYLIVSEKQICGGDN